VRTGINIIGLSNYKSVKIELFDLIYSKLLGIHIKYSATNSATWGFGKNLNW